MANFNMSFSNDFALTSLENINNQGVALIRSLASSVDGNDVKSVNNTLPDINGNVDVGTVRSVNDVLPDINGNVTIDVSGNVDSVNGISPVDGNVTTTLVSQGDYESSGAYQQAQVIGYLGPPINKWSNLFYTVNNQDFTNSGSLEILFSSNFPDVDTNGKVTGTILYYDSDATSWLVSTGPSDYSCPVWNNLVKTYDFQPFNLPNYYVLSLAYNYIDDNATGIALTVPPNTTLNLTSLVQNTGQIKTKIAGIATLILQVAGDTNQLLVYFPLYESKLSYRLMYNVTLQIVNPDSVEARFLILLQKNSTPPIIYNDSPTIISCPHNATTVQTVYAEYQITPQDNADPFGLQFKRVGTGTASPSVQMLACQLYCVLLNPIGFVP
jgi:hypothetical protein